MTAESAVNADNHVHTEWSWDATLGDMDATCRRALEVELRTVAFTEHADFVHGPKAVFDAGAYLECVERCRSRYQELTILSGVELGEPHRFAVEVGELLSAGFDRVLASVHGVAWNGRFTDASERGLLTPENCGEYFQVYLAETEALLMSDVPFEVLAHIDYPKRYWPVDAPYAVRSFEDELRSVLKALARRGGVLEVNTTRGGEPQRFLWPGPEVLQWWREEGGRAISFGSDAHRPDDLGRGLDVAGRVAAAAGFVRRDDANGFWLR